jgi:GTP cyclohydrolase I
LTSVVELISPAAGAEPRAISPDDWRRYERYVGEIVTALGMDLATPGTRDTPRRFLQALRDATAGYDGDPKLRTVFASERPPGVNGSHSQIIEGPIAFHALCEHHALPFFGVAHVGYVAGPEIIGISKLTRLVRLYARRFTVQERVGEQIADVLEELVQPRGVAVRLEAAHLCTQMRGVAEHGSRTVTTFWRGLYDERAELRAEFTAEIASRG